MSDPKLVLADDRITHRPMDTLQLITLPVNDIHPILRIQESSATKLATLRRNFTNRLVLPPAIPSTALATIAFIVGPHRVLTHQGSTCPPSGSIRVADPRGPATQRQSGISQCSGLQQGRE